MEVRRDTELSLTRTLMQNLLDIGREEATFDVPADRLIHLRRPDRPPILADPTQALREALESPLRYPSLRLALTPDDHVTIVVDDHLTHLAKLATVVIDHVIGAGVEPTSITLLSAPSPSRQTWINDLPEVLEDVRIETHDPHDRNRLAYLASTKAGRRIYLNRSAVDADQLVLLTGPHFDPLLGYAGAEGSLYPALSDAATRQSWNDSLSMKAPSHEDWPVRREANEVSWLLGSPFYVQVVEGPGDGVVQVIAGAADTAAEGRQWVDRCWRATVPELADLAIATISGDPARQDFNDMARAIACASRVVKPDGIIALLCEACPDFGDGFRTIAQAGEPEEAFRILKEKPPADWPAAYAWLESVRKSRVFLHSGLSPDIAEELFTTPMLHARQAQRLIDAGGKVVILPDAHKLMVTLSRSVSVDS